MQSVKLHDKYSRVIVVTHEDGMEVSYLQSEGNLYPGRVWRALAPSQQAVNFFLPFPDGMPQVLSVEEP